MRLGRPPAQTAAKEKAPVRLHPRGTVNATRVPGLEESHRGHFPGPLASAPRPPRPPRPSWQHEKDFPDPAKQDVPSVILLLSPALAAIPVELLDPNQWADELTHPDYKGFNMERRLRVESCRRQCELVLKNSTKLQSCLAGPRS